MSIVFNILIIATAHSSLGTSGAPTGLWLEEFSTPYYLFEQAGARVTVASLPGGRIPIDPSSVAEQGSNPQSVERFMRDEQAQSLLNSAKPLSAVSSSGWDIVFIPGGHGAMWDLASSSQLGEFLSKAWADGAVLGSVCHGPAGLINVLDESGKPLVAGRSVNAFSNSEEAAINLTNTVPFALESKLRELGAIYEKGTDFTSHAVCDGRLVTGQNPMSSETVARLILETAQKIRSR